MKKVLIATAAAVIGLTAMATEASAAIACNREGECWHVRNAYTYRPEFGVTIHENNWRWGTADRFRWREHTGRGYWRNGVWIRF